MIKIKMQKIVVKGEKRIKILELKALRYEDLPNLYLANANAAYVYLDNDGKSLCDSKEAILTIGMHYAPQFFDLAIGYFRTAGKRLKKINEKLRAENSGWEGEETVEI